MSNKHIMPGFAAEVSFDGRLTGYSENLNSARRAQARNMVIPMKHGSCECSSAAGIGCSASSDDCDDGYEPHCLCSIFSNGCRCKPEST